MSKSPCSFKDLALIMISTMEEMAAGRSRTTSDDHTIEILGKMQEELSNID